MDKSLVQRVEELEKENTLLKEQLESTKSKLYGWDNIRQYINDELKEMSEIRKYGNFNGKVESAISQIIRETFDLKFIKHVDNSNYQQSKEIAEAVIQLVKKYFVKGWWYECNKKKGGQALA